MNKYLTKAFALAGLVLFSLSSCQEEEGNVIDYTPGNALMISGPKSVEVGESKEYYLNMNIKADDYDWSIGSGATISENAANDAYVTVTFDAAGEYTLIVTKGDASGELKINVETQPAVTVSYNGTGVLRNGVSDTVFFNFTTPLSGLPDFEVNTDSSGFYPGKLAFTSGTLGPLVEVDADSAYAIYTAGNGNGIPEALFQDITSNETFGSINVDSAFVQLYRVDNIAPIVDLSYSSLYANDSTVLKVTATFSEEVMPDNPTDTTLLIAFEGAGVEAETDTLVATEDPLVYTFDYTVNGDSTGTLNVSLENVVDLAGNEPGLVRNASAVTIDNDNPTLSFADAVDQGNGLVSISMSSDEVGTGYYLILADGADAPTKATEFDGDMTMSVSPSLSTKTINVAQGDYDVYYIVEDRAGNFGTISTKEDLTVN
ncbi:hypothetical protein E1176_07860 [Fulvivirga sp. RKSG066]|uniref:hypothetical protein n=1 Tax=Fulvivirga aurantia TaxID=2529383 RepID=UPI0012BC4281|nr:hypothetical protein [Fulvivirga aurantia]MTI20933.1 hypothetical protein [Fulvivirga aurantia]